MNKIKTIICLIAFVLVSAASAEQHIEVKTMQEVKQVFPICPTPRILLLSATTQSVQNFGFCRLTVSPAGDVTLISFIKGPADDNWGQYKNGAELSRYRIIMLGTLVKWKANPSATTRIVDVKLRPFLSVSAH